MSEHGQATELMWLSDIAIYALSGQAADTKFVAGVEKALGVPLPSSAHQYRCGPNAEGLRLIGIGPDTWWLVGQKRQCASNATTLDAALAGQHSNVVEIGQGYSVARVRGTRAADWLAAGCPLDLAPERFGAASAAGTRLFDASCTIWSLGDTGGFEFAVRRSYVEYVRERLEHARLTWGITAQ